MSQRFSNIQKQVWSMHLDGMAMSEIAATTKLDASFIHATITAIWRTGGGLE